MLLNLSKTLSKINFLNFLFFLIPASLIAGNLVVNINVFLIIVFSFAFFGKKIFKIDLKLIDKIIFLYFLFVLITGVYNNIDSYITDELRDDLTITIKSLLYLRFFFLYLIIRYLVNENLLNIKFFFISSFVFSLFVSLDIFYQLIFGQDIFGYEGLSRKLSGPFGDEYIAGGYLQRFSLFSLFLFPVFFKIQKKYLLDLLLIFLSLIYFLTIILSGNRMPLLLFVFSFFLLLLLERNLRKLFIPLVLIFIISFVSIFKFNPDVNSNFKNFYILIKKTALVFIPNYNQSVSALGHVKEFQSFYYTWQMNKYIGGGIKTFRSNCHNRKNIKSIIVPGTGGKFICNTHPHNYYLHILTELGLVGLIILLVIFFKTLYLSLKKKFSKFTNLRSRYIISPFILTFFIEIFPLKSTGGFFTTSNATFIFLILSFTIALSINKN